MLRRIPLVLTTTLAGALGLMRFVPDGWQEWLGAKPTGMGKADFAFVWWQWQAGLIDDGWPWGRGWWRRLEVSDGWRIYIGARRATAAVGWAHLTDRPPTRASREYRWGYFRVHTWHVYVPSSYVHHDCVGPPPSAEERAGFLRSIPSKVWAAEAPLWSLFLAASIHPALAFTGVLRRRRRSKRNECLTCGYCLTGLPEPRCPECGVAFDVPNPAD